LLGRIQLFNNVSSPKLQRIVSWLGGLRLKRFWERGWYKPYIIFGAGFGQVRHEVPLGAYNGETTSDDSYIDTRVSGLGNMSGGAGLYFKFVPSVGLVIEENTFILFPNFAVQFDLNVGVVFSI